MNRIRIRPRVFFCSWVLWGILLLDCALGQDQGLPTPPDLTVIQEKAETFQKLGAEEKKTFFKELSDVDKGVLFQSLSDEDKVLVFNSLDEKEKLVIFQGLDQAGREIALKGLSDGDKKLLFERLPEKDRREWLKKFPRPELSLPPKDMPLASKKAPPAVEKEPAAPTPVEDLLSGRFPTSISPELKQFGYEFFEEGFTSFAPVIHLPVGQDYLIGPGDQFAIHLWGKVEESYEVTVSREGGIVLPRVGYVNVNGLKFGELKDHLLRRFRGYFPEFEMTVTMVQLKTIDVFVVGEAKRPGTYSVSALSTAVSALHAAGGPTKNGSLRSIRVMRNNDVVGTLDLYEFFVKGLQKGNVRLQPGDTLFIPVLGPVVGVSGNVRRPAIYELLGRETIGEVLQMAGGLMPSGYLQHVVIERIEGHHRRAVRSFSLDPSGGGSANENLAVPLADGDLVKIYPVHEGLRQVVHLEGHVKYPKEYEYRNGMKLNDMLTGYDDLLPEPFLPRAEIIRLVQPDLHPEIIEFDLGALLRGDPAQNLPLQELDRVRIFPAVDKQHVPEVTVSGAVRTPGTYRLFKGMRVKDLIFRAGNLSKQAFLEEATLSRLVPGGKGTDVIKLRFLLKKAMAGDSSENLPLQPDDILFVREIPKYNAALERKALLEGEFIFPGEYTFSEGERISSLIARAGGLTQEAYPQGAVFVRESVKTVQQARIEGYISQLEEDVLTTSTYAAETAMDQTTLSITKETLGAKKQLLEKLRKAKPTGRMVINLTEILVMPSSNYDFELRPGDRLIVGKKPDYVNVLGEVYNSTALFAEKDKTVEYYINLVGGATNSANEKEIYLVKANGTVISKSQEGYLGTARWDDANHRWSAGGFSSVKVDPGDTIIVPKKVVSYPWLKIVKDVTQIMYQIAVAAGVIIVAF